MVYSRPKFKRTAYRPNGTRLTRVQQGWKMALKNLGFFRFFKKNLKNLKSLGF